MSYLGWKPPQAPSARSGWRWFPWATAAAMGFVVAVNIGMVYAALSSFPGKAGDNEFELSNHYDAVIDHVQREAALGWIVAAQPDAAGRPVVTLTAPGGAPLHGAVVVATAERPLGTAGAQRLGFVEAADGRYVADTVLPLPGQWDLQMTVSAQGHDVVMTRRVYVR